MPDKGGRVQLPPRRPAGQRTFPRAGSRLHNTRPGHRANRLELRPRRDLGRGGQLAGEGGSAAANVCPERSALG